MMFDFYSMVKLHRKTFRLCQRLQFCSPKGIHIIVKFYHACPEFLQHTELKTVHAQNNRSSPSSPSTWQPHFSIWIHSFHHEGKFTEVNMHRTCLHHGGFISLSVVSVSPCCTKCSSLLALNNRIHCIGNNLFVDFSADKIYIALGDWGYSIVAQHLPNKHGFLNLIINRKGKRKVILNCFYLVAMVKLVPEEWPYTQHLSVCLTYSGCITKGKVTSSCSGSIHFKKYL